VTAQSELTPRARIEAECARRGRSAVVDDCIALLNGEVEERLILSLTGPAAARKYFDGREHDDLYWFRVWALRGLLWAWDARATPQLRAAMSDEAWRVREMAAKVTARHGVGDALPEVLALRDDPVPRVRAAAERAVARITQAQA
jgi:HEAT repeat protein